MEHINRSHRRSFSLNIFRMNAQELIEITRRVNDPDEGIRLMAVANREAGSQTHREVTRRVHNFVAAALTLVEHTRIFMRENYSGTPILDRYQAKIDSDFKDAPLVRFVQDLRNYILHNGLPQSVMYMHFESNRDLSDGSGALETGIHIPAAPLLEWRNWSEPARTFIENSGEYIDIRTVAETYTDSILPFHDWLQAELDKFHSADLEELRALQELMNQSEKATRSSPVPAAGIAEAQNNVATPEQQFVFASDRASALDAAGLALLKKVRKIELQAQRGNGFASERPMGATITDKEMLSAPLYWGTDVAGRRVFVFIYKDGDSFGFDEEAFAEMQEVTKQVLQTDWARRTLSRSFVETTTIKWLQSSFGRAEPSSLPEMIAHDGRDAVQPLELWAPVAHLEVQTPFVLGPAEVVTITQAMIDGREAEAANSAPQQRDKTAVLFKELRSRMQGLAAVVFKLDAEPDKIRQDGEVIARIVVAFIRFFSPAAVNFPVVCANALLGSELVPTSNLLVLGEGTFAYSQAIVVPYTGWRISETELRNMRPGLDAVGALVRPEGLSAFALAVRSSLLLFSTGATFSNPIERLSYTLSALESLLLRHSAEPAEFNVAERMGFLLSQKRTEREEVARNVREAYRLRSRQDISPLFPGEMASVATFLRRAHHVIGTALGNVNRFGTVSEFVSAIESLRNQNPGEQ